MLASKATAYYCCTQALPVPPSPEMDDWAEHNGICPLHLLANAKPKCVYLAGPFFSMMERWLIEQSRDALSQQGMKVFSPLHDVGIGGAADVVKKDLAAISSCDILFALLDHLDSGTLFEVGYARSIGKPVVAFCQNETSESLKMLSGSDCAIFDDFVTAIYHTNWVANRQ
jgi:nucleoside 2-deoxyribosyltransferase